MNRKEHIQSLTVKNFKCFESFEMNEIGNVNLIVGGNNVGKSTLLEALLMTVNPADAVSHLHHSFVSRVGRDFNIDDFSRSLSFFINDKSHRWFGADVYRLNGLKESVGFRFVKKIEVLQNPNLNQLLQLRYGSVQKLRSEEFLVFEFEGTDTDVFGLSDESPDSFGNSYMPFVGSQIFYEYDLVSFYSENVQVDKTVKAQFIDDVRCIIPEIVDIEVSTGIISNLPNLGVRLSNSNQLIPLGMFGDGSIRLIRILLEMYTVQSSGLLMIDEVDSGIHLGKLEEFWSKLLTVSLKLGIQLFATTHNASSITALTRVAGQFDLFGDAANRIRHFVLEKDFGGHTRSYAYSFDQLEHAIEHGNNIMGR